MRPLHTFITLLVLLLATTSTFAAEGEYQVKAAMLYNFAKFVDWPADSFGNESRLTFCIAGKSLLNSPMLQMQGKHVKGRTVAIRQIGRPDDISSCQILFIPQSERARMSDYLQQASQHTILTVSDLERFATSGGMIGFYEDENKVRFEINQEAALRHRLQISSHLLNLARRVR